jgi:hypothetical protein
LEVRTSNLRRAEEVASAVDGVLEVQTYGDLLHVFVDRIADRQDELLGALSRADVDVIGWRQTRPRMEEAFISLVRREMEGNADTPVAEQTADPEDLETVVDSPDGGIAVDARHKGS